jgi:hypothetical protein
VKKIPERLDFSTSNWMMGFIFRITKLKKKLTPILYLVSPIHHKLHHL